MNAPFAPAGTQVRLADLSDRHERARIDDFVLAHPQGTPFHRPAWFCTVAEATGNMALALVAERAGALSGLLPLDCISSPIFGRVLASSGFAVDGGLLVHEGGDPQAFFDAARELAVRLSCPTVELRGGVLPSVGEGWSHQDGSHCTFARPLAGDDESELTAIPRKQRAEVRKSLSADLEVHVGRSEDALAEHYRVFCESYRNLGTPVFPRKLLGAVLRAFGEDADILTVRHEGQAVASVLSLYHKGTVMPYWGGGTWAARRLRANERMYFELMLHARRRGMHSFDFGRSKTDSGAYHYKRNWGFEPRALTYANWTAPGAAMRDMNPQSAKRALQVRLWQRLPLGIANRLGPLIARGIG
ncbi:FemAB family XrtA/PEP-CTERM system-associated protein [Novosphingobium mangrovi (ex Hu et al. 2023)]|uniref:FemAB family PEP-CTERM system-associated protein n=1 Tax=Novosphingobium mangrovi (ex Hu et al. 2023) TaxID=2930094 RepID=A0ABT0A954_9SPHN|nr:FemAB family XrtA/PEP-CTERM system-associated protein [Novosphingobium mangrovi (ex Hu et al. 2023)]MCJ1959712.1 FemAB family PEP-CTERM system-associated protein [Novosphingobium mangrovi (ex Hu et al. 2023)]